MSDAPTLKPDVVRRTALMRCSFYSEILQVATSMNVIVPQPVPRQTGIPAPIPEAKMPVLYLLHGLSDDHTAWTRKTSIERHVASSGLVVVMPEVLRSYYTDMAHGGRYWTFLSEELPALVQSMFPVSSAREDTFAAGLSMGGYGAFKLALTLPERFAAAASLSGALDLAHRFSEPQNVSDDMRAVFGDPDEVAGSADDVLFLARRVAESGGPKPKLYQCCGTEDFLYEDNVRARDALRGLGFDLRYDEGPGQHEWGYWDREIQKVLAWLPRRPNA